MNLIFIAASVFPDRIPSQLSQLWSIDYFQLDSAQLREHWRQVVKAELWVHLPAAPSLEDRTAWINVYYVSLDKNNHAFLTQEAATKVCYRLGPIYTWRRVCQRIYDE